MEHKLPPILPGNFYHLHNKSSAHQQLFVAAENYHFFLEKYRHYFSHIADTYAFVLMPEHFHFLVKFKEEGDMLSYFAKKRSKLEELDTMINEQFDDLFSAYSKSFNKKQNHKGDLFLPLVKRKKITDHDYLQKLVRYFHQEPVFMGLVKDQHKYLHSSYQALLNGDPEIVYPGAVYELFNDPDSFQEFHRQLDRDFHYNFLEEK